MELIKLTHENLGSEHICCAISNETDIQVSSKKAWLKDRLDEGLVFLKGNVRGKCFIEYIPAEFAWTPIKADGYMFVNCLWVSGQFKGQGYSNILLNECIADSKKKGKKGLVILSSKKKMGFLSDPKYMRYKGFKLADIAPPYFELLYLPFENNAQKPCFASLLKENKHNKMCKGFTVFYTSQCPFTAKYVPILQDLAKKHNAEFCAVHVLTCEQAQNVPTPFTSFSLFYDGVFVTHEILSEKKFEKILIDKGF